MWRENGILPKTPYLDHIYADNPNFFNNSASEEVGEACGARKGNTVMAVEITGQYTKNLRVEVTHGPSGTVMHTAAPVDNQGDGSSFSPTDLVATALGTCMVTIMGIIAEREGIDFSQCRFKVEKHMSAQPPRRIDRLPVTIYMPSGLTPAQRRKLEKGARTCPVCRSLLPEIERNVDFQYPD